MSYVVVPAVSPTLVEHAEPAPAPRVPTHLVGAVLCTVLCFAPTGVAAVVCAGQVATRLALGDLAGARRASARARRLCWASVSVTAFFLAVLVVGADGYSAVH